MPAPEYILNKRILNLRILRWRGCGDCPYSDQECQQARTQTKVWLIHTGRQRWDNWGHIVDVFRPGELVEVEVTHDNRVIYCASATSTIYPGIHDFIDLVNFSQELP